MKMSNTSQRALLFSTFGIYIVPVIVRQCADGSDCERAHRFIFGNYYIRKLSNLLIATSHAPEEKLRTVCQI